MAPTQNKKSVVLATVDDVVHADVDQGFRNLHKYNCLQTGYYESLPPEVQRLLPTAKLPGGKGLVAVYGPTNKNGKASANATSNFPFIMFVPNATEKKEKNIPAKERGFTRHGFFRHVVVANMFANWLWHQDLSVRLRAAAAREFVDWVTPRVWARRLSRGGHL